MDTWAGYVNDQLAGFISINKHFQFAAEVHVIGILEEFHHQGLGRKLSEAAENSLQTEGFKFIQVKTISENRVDENYAKTRQFYLKMGFVPFEEIKSCGVNTTRVY